MKRGTNRLWGAGLLLGGVVLAGCGAGDSGAGPGGDVAIGAITGVRWVPQSVTADGERRSLPPGTDAYVKFDPGKKKGAGGKSGGSTGCNRLGADVTVHGDTLEVSDAVSTTRGCGGARGRFEEHFLDVFTGAFTAEVSDGGDTLTLTREDGDRIRLEKAPRGGAS